METALQEHWFVLDSRPAILYGPLGSVPIGTGGLRP